MADAPYPIPPLSDLLAEDEELSVPQYRYGPDEEPPLQRRFVAGPTPGAIAYMEQVHSDEGRDNAEMFFLQVLIHVDIEDIPSLIIQILPDQLANVTSFDARHSIFGTDDLYMRHVYEAAFRERIEELRRAVGGIGSA